MCGCINTHKKLHSHFKRESFVIKIRSNSIAVSKDKWEDDKNKYSLKFLINHY